jgi:hypothetical protein
MAYNLRNRKERNMAESETGGEDEDNDDGKKI